MAQDLNRELDDSQLSRINAAGIINITLENLWRDTYSAMAGSNLILWNRKLDAIWAILGGEETDGSVNDKKMNQMDLKIYETGSLGYKKIGFKTKGSESKPLQYLLLKNKSLFLRRLQNKQGKGTAYKSDDDDDID